jgi:hypothetical protein
VIGQSPVVVQTFLTYYAREAIDRMYRCVIARIAVPPTLVRAAEVIE